MEKQHKNQLDSTKSVETNVRRAKRSTGSYIGAAKKLQKVVNLQNGHNAKAKKKFKAAELKSLYRKAKELSR